GLRMDNEATFTIDPKWITKVLAWADHHYPYFSYFCSHEVPYPHGGFEQVFFAGKESYSLDQIKYLPLDSEKVGLLSYDLKNQFEHLKSSNSALIDSPDSVFFVPTLKIRFSPREAIISHPSPHDIFTQINAFEYSQQTLESLDIIPL